MSVFKFACPVCGQHIECTADKAGSQMECPTCFRKLVVPHPSAEGSSSLVLTASEVQTRIISFPGGAPPPPVPVKKKSPLAPISAGVLVLCVAAGAIVFRKAIFGGWKHPATVSPGSNTNLVSQISTPPDPPTDSDKYWRTNLAGVTIPDTPAAGRVSGKSFTIERATIKGGHLDLRQGTKWPPEVGLSVHLFAKQPEDLGGKVVSIEPDRERVPRVVLRIQNEEGMPVNEECLNGYSLRIEFGTVNSGKLPGKIYFCGADLEKSYVLGSFEAEIRRPTPPKPKP